MTKLIDREGEKKRKRKKREVRPENGAQSFLSLPVYPCR
jgi:hypothetical protein